MQRDKKGKFVKGHQVPKEWRKIVSEAKKGKHPKTEFKKGHKPIFTKERNMKISKALTGIKRSEETKQKMRKPKSLEARRKMSERLKEDYKTGRRIPPWTDKKRSKETIKKITETRKRLFKEGKLVSWNKDKKTGKLTTDHKKKISKGVKKHLPSTAFKRGDKHTKIWKENMRQILLEKWQNPEFVEERLKTFKFRPNKPEKLLMELIKKNNLPFNYTGDGEIWFRGKTMSFNPDFLSKNPKHIIEVFGDYWHNRKDMEKRDKERLETYAKYGYKTLVIWEHELTTNKYGKTLSKQEIINKIKVFIN